MSKPFREGEGGRFACAFVRQDVYRSGFKSATLAAEAQTRLRAQLTGAPKATGNGPFRTTLAEAFADYANERLPYLKGAAGDVRQINRYRRAANLPIILVEPIEATSPGASVYWAVNFQEETTRKIAPSLVEHRNAQKKKV